MGQALGEGFLREGHEVKFGSRDPGKGADAVYRLGKGVMAGSHTDAVEFGEVIVVAIPYTAVKSVVHEIGATKFKGKIVLDVTNPLTASHDWAVGFDTSAAEELAKLAPGAKVVKVFNHVFAEHMPLGRIRDVKLLALVASDEAKTKETILGLARSIGFDAVDAGPLKSARYMEAMGMQLIHLGYGLKMGSGIGLSLARKR